MAGLFQSISNMVMSTVIDGQGQKTSDKQVVSKEDTKEMVQLMDWTYDKSSNNIPGLGNSKEMAEEYLRDKNGNVNAAVDALIRWQILNAAKSSIMKTLGEMPNLKLNLPNNAPEVMAIQMRMIQAIAYISGCTDTNTLLSGTYLSLLGGDAGKVLTSVLGKNYNIEDLSKLDMSKIQSIKDQVSNKILTKLNLANKKNLSKGLSILVGIVGGSIDAITTYAIAAAAKSIFLKGKGQEKSNDDLEEKRMQVLINMALVDGMYSKEEGEILKQIVSTLTISEESKQKILKEIDSPTKKDIDLNIFKKDPILSKCLISTLDDILKADGKEHPSEQKYFNDIKKALEN